MRKFEFEYAKDSINLYALVITCIMLSTIVFFNLQDTIYISIVYFIMSIFTFIIIRSHVRKSKKTIHSIIFNDNQLIINFKHTLVDPIILHFDEILYEYNDDCVTLYNLNEIKTIYILLNNIKNNKNEFVDILATKISKINKWKFYYSPNKFIVNRALCFVLNSFPISSMNSIIASEIQISYNNLGSLDNSILIDDIRFHPQNSTMKTFAYNEILNKVSSISDQNNKPSYFEYDGFGRLISTSDFKRNLTKTNFYLLNNK